MVLRKYVKFLPVLQPRLILSARQQFQSGVAQKDYKVSRLLPSKMARNRLQSLRIL